MNTQFRRALTIILALCFTVVLFAQVALAQNEPVTQPDRPSVVAKADEAAPRPILAHPEVYEYSSDLDTLRAQSYAHSARALANPGVYAYSGDLDQLRTMGAHRAAPALAHPEVYEYSSDLDTLRTRSQTGDW
jgi:hypothetical protein